MNWTDLFMNYGICVFIMVVVSVTAIVFFKIGYLYGHQDGWHEGMYKGSHFGRLKILESEQNNGRKKL